MALNEDQIMELSKLGKGKAVILQNNWLESPEATMQYLIDGLSDASNYFDIEVHGLSVHICLVEQ